ncbi:unnamed protein product [Orchesella dallaii]|uniref:SCP domain-containing protein n=1 Tax=Orchesella dallaii TaxID=48710 RepID=A0ABP1R736_9HEXA
MARLALAAFCLVAFAAPSRALTPMEYGMDMACTAHKAACWYEYLKQFPKTDAKAGGQCLITCDFQKDFAKKYEGDMGKNTFISGVSSQPMESLPSEYTSNCIADLKSASADTSDDESDALNDGSQEYPFRAFAYCIMKTLRGKYGDKAIEAVKTEKTHSLKHWKQTLLDRDNEFRALHGSEPFVRVSDLDDAAQQWADQNAAECNMHHSKNTDAIRQWHGAGTGESLSSGGGGAESPPEDSAYVASNGWYEENKDYPFATGIQGASDPRFHSVGHFTQTVWKGSKYVGYGYAYSEKCKKFFIAARYSPAGNMEGAFQENVLPPQ